MSVTFPRDVLEACPAAERASQAARIGSSIDAPLGETYLALVEDRVHVLTRASSLEAFRDLELDADPRLDLGHETFLVLRLKAGGESKLRVGFSEEGPIARVIAALASARAIRSLTAPAASSALAVAAAPITAPAPALPPAPAPAPAPAWPASPFGEIQVRPVDPSRRARAALIDVLYARAEQLARREEDPFRGPEDRVVSPRVREARDRLATGAPRDDVRRDDVPRGAKRSRAPLVAIVLAVLALIVWLVARR